MALLPRITAEQHSALPEVLRPEYTQKDGVFVLDVTPTEGWALEDVGGLKTALQKERQNAQAVQVKLQAFGDLDPAAAQDALKKVGEMADWTPEQKVQEKIEAERTQLESKHAQALAKEAEEKQGLLSQLQGHIVTSTATAAIAKNGGSVELLLPVVSNAVRVDKDPATGALVARVIGEDGNPRISMQQGNTGYMDIGEFVEGLKTQDTYAPAFQGTGKSGTGSTGSDGSQGGKSGGGSGTTGGYVTDSSGTIIPTSLDAVADNGI